MKAIPLKTAKSGRKMGASYSSSQFKRKSGCFREVLAPCQKVEARCGFQECFLLAGAAIS